MQDKSDNIHIDDAALVKQCQRGNPDAMGRLIVKYQDRLYNAILKICGNSDDAAELTQESFVKVLENIDTFRSQSSFYTWLFRIGVNLTLNVCKRKIRLGMRSLEAGDSEDKNLKFTEALADARQETPAAEAEKQELIQRVLAGLEKLEDQQRTIIVLRDIEGMDYEQIAEVLNLELGTVKSRLSRARFALKELLQAIRV